MSHIVEIKTEIRDGIAVSMAARRMELPEPEQGTFEMFAGTETGLGVRLPDWRFPVVCNLQSGQIRFDNYGGRWGEQKHLDGFLQRYAVEKAKLEARKQGYTTAEQLLDDGSIRVTIEVGGAA